MLLNAGATSNPKPNINPSGLLHLTLNASIPASPNPFSNTGTKWTSWQSGHRSMIQKRLNVHLLFNRSKLKPKRELDLMVACDSYQRLYPHTHPKSVPLSQPYTALPYTPCSTMHPCHLIMPSLLPLPLPLRSLLPGLCLQEISSRHFGVESQNGE